MKTKAVRLYGENDLRLEEFELPAIKEDEILAKIVSDSVCMSTHKEAIQGTKHKRVPADIAVNPVIVGHELCGEIIEVGKKWRDKYSEGMKFSLQAGFNDPADIYAAAGYSFKYCGGDATYIILPPVAMERDCIIPYTGDAFYLGSLSEPMSCIIGGFHVNYHTRPGSYVHDMGIKEGGALILIAGHGPMGLGAIDYALHSARKPRLLVVTGTNDTGLSRAASLYTAEEAAKNGVELRYFNTKTSPDAAAELLKLTNGKGYDDVYVFAPAAHLVELGVAVMGYDSCLNFFAGPTDKAFSANFNFYNLHYNAAHVAGNSGGNTGDLVEALDLISHGLINPSAMVTHICGLDAVADTVINLPDIPGGKKLAYTHISLPLTAISEFGEKGKTDPLFAELDRLVKKHNGLWNAEAEKYLLAHAQSI